MNAEGFRALEDAFSEAEALDEPRRAAVVERLRRVDPVLAERLRLMLASDDDEASGVLEAIGTAFDTPTEHTEILGDRYEILGELGEGGFGVVFLARDRGKLDRLVAVKVVKPGMDTRAVLARFEDERRALAILDHPSVVTAVDAGATPGGRPYIVMPVVPGLPITQYCHARALPLHDRLRVFIEALRGVQHAHGRGVIHRDLKPGNILVALVDGRPWARVIDFGLAKALAGTLTPHATLTQEGQVLGTPEYMSPEQARGGTVDVRSDVYALGAVLYELLTGRPPLTIEELRADSPQAPHLAILTRSPQPPSRIARASHGAEAIPAELDWIVLRCLEKEPERRFASADALGADLERYLHGQRVESGPPARLYRLRRLILRHRAVVIGIVLAVAGLVGGSMAAVSYAMRSQQDRLRAEQVSATVRTILTGLDPDVAQGRDNTLLVMMLEKAGASVEASKLEPEVEVELRETLALAYASIGRTAEADRQARLALSLMDELDEFDSARRIPLLMVRLRAERWDAPDAETNPHIPPLRAEIQRLASLHLPPGSEDSLRVEVDLMALTPLHRTVDSSRELLDRLERTLGPDHRLTLRAMRIAAWRPPGHGDPHAVRLLDEARRRALERYGEDDPIVHVGLASEIYSRSMAGMPPEQLIPWIESHLTAAERVLGRLNRTVIASLQNLAGQRDLAGDIPGALRDYADAYEREVIASGEASGLAGWIAGNVALLALRAGDLDRFHQLEARLWEMQPDGPSVGSHEIFATELARMGEDARAQRWIDALRLHPEVQARLQARVDAIRSERERGSGAPADPQPSLPRDAP